MATRTEESKRTGERAPKTHEAEDQRDAVADDRVVAADHLHVVLLCEIAGMKQLCVLYCLTMIWELQNPQSLIVNPARNFTLSSFHNFWIMQLLKS